MKKITSSLAVVCLTVILFASNLMASGNAWAAPAAAPSFSGVTIDGKPFSSASLKGKAYIVNFFATWCPPCRGEIPDMVVLQKAYAAKGFTFIGIALDDSSAPVKNLIRKDAINYPVIMGNKAIVSKFNPYIDGGINGIPSSFVVDSSGNLTQALVGAQSKEAFERIINSAIGRKAGK
ncbi:MAG TPA: TlpA disulfide reductase family protein [Chlorobaculum sp.]|nr:TlpA disulfide reductase family protein [Chlorobaculum sp.]